MRVPKTFAELATHFILPAVWIAFAATCTQVMADPVAKLERKPPAQRIEAFALPTQDQVVQELGGQFFIHLKGAFLRDAWSLLWLNPPGNTPATVDEKFDLKVPVTAEFMTLQFKAVGPRGEVEAEEIPIHVLEFNTLTHPAPARKFDIAVGLGPMCLSYSQSSPISANFAFTQYMISAIGTFTMPLPGGLWEFGANGVISPIALTSTTPSVSIILLGGNAHLGYNIAKVRKPWGLTVFGGLYYSTTFSAGANIGYVNLFGPTFYPRIRRALGETDTVDFAPRYAFASDGNTFLSFSNFELGGILTWTHKLRNEHVWGLRAEYTQLQTTSSDLTLVNSTSIGLSGFYGL